MKNKNDFEFKYVAPTNEERKEIESIRNSYLEENKKTSKLDYLRQLNNRVKDLPQIFSLVIGILGTLIFGLGLTMILEWEIILWGVVLCVVALVPIAFAYPVYIKSDKILRDRYRDEILRLSNELLNEDKESKNK